MIDYDKVVAEYARHRGPTQWTPHPGVLESLCSVVGSTSKVLEVGCGTGNYIIALESLLGCPCWGIDPSEQMLSRARERTNRVHFELGRAERLYPDGPWPGTGFDLVFSVDVIHHIQDRPRYFREAYRVLKPHGKICTVTDSEWVICHRQPLSTYFPETVEGELERYPRISELQAWMEQAGFSEIAETMVECPYQLTDIQAYRDKAYSALHLLSEGAFLRGIERMEWDLRTGPIACVSRYTLLWGKKV